jgi:hypothetical protein
MPRTRCRSCRGIYQTVGADGQRYFHVCPPLNIAELEAAVAAGRITLPPSQVRPGETETPREAYEARSYERPNKRDERPSVETLP